VRAAILAVGSELLSTDRLDTNSLRVTEALERHGVELVRKCVVADDEDAIAGEVTRLLSLAALVVVGGGLGPTADDVTREAVARALARHLVEDPEVVAGLERRFAALDRTPSSNNRRQTRVISGAVVLPNPKGTAPGQRIEIDDRTLFLLPGVPFELTWMVANHLEPWLAAHSNGSVRAHRTLKVAVRPESEVDQLLEPVYERFGRSWITILAGSGEIKLRLWAVGNEAARERRLDEMSSAVRATLGDTIFGEGDEATLEGVVGAELVRREESVATAESCTGGLLAERLTRVPGSSRYFPGGVVTYSNDEKTRRLGVDAALLAEHGAVSQPVAEAMAIGARQEFATDWALAISGVAGPEGGSDEKPVGTVHVALAGPRDEVTHRRVRLPGDRERVRWLASQVALEMLRRCLIRDAAGRSR